MTTELKSPLLTQSPHYPCGDGHHSYNGGGYSDGYGDGSGRGNGNGGGGDGNGRGKSTGELVQGYRSTI